MYSRVNQRPDVSQEKNLCPGQIGKDFGDMICSPGISHGRSSPAIARSWELAVLWLPGFCIEEFSISYRCWKAFLGTKKGKSLHVINRKAPPY